MAGTILADEAFTGIKAATRRNGDFAFSERATGVGAGGREAGKRGDTRIEPIDTGIGQPGAPLVGGGVDRPGETDDIIGGPCGPDVEGENETCDPKFAEMDKPGSQIVDRIGSHDHHDREDPAGGDQETQHGVNLGKTALIPDGATVFVVGVRDAVAAYGNIDVGLQKNGGGVGIGDGAIGGEIKADLFPLIVREATGGAHPFMNARGFDQGFPAKEAEMENTAGAKADKGALDGLFPYGNRHGRMKLRACVAIRAAQIAGVINDESQTEGGVSRVSHRKPHSR